MDKNFYRIYNNYFNEDNFDKTLNYLQNRILPRSMYGTRRDKYIERLEPFRINRDGEIIYVKENIERKVITPDVKKEFLSALGETFENHKIGQDKFYDIIQEKYIGITQEDIKNLFRKNENYQLTRRIKPVGKSQRIVSKAPNNIWQMDHLELNRTRGNYRYLLNVIDLFSRYGWSIPVTSKDTEHTINALNSILNSIRPMKPKLLQMDNAQEYLAREMKQFLRDKNIKMRYTTTYKPQENGVVERFNQTLLEGLKKYFVRNNNKTWIDYIEDVVLNYNDTKHSTTEFAPESIFRDNLTENEKQQVIKNVRKNLKIVKNIPYKVGDFVRISTFKTDSNFRDNIKSKNPKKNIYTANWSKEKYRIIQVYKTTKPEQKQNQYALEDMDGNILIATSKPKKFFHNDLLVTSEPTQAQRQEQEEQDVIEEDLRERQPQPQPQPRAPSNRRRRVARRLRDDDDNENEQQQTPFQIGERVKVKFNVNNRYRFYEGIIRNVLSNGNYLIAFDGYDEIETIPKNMERNISRI